jgi:hypothetical protein
METIFDLAKALCALHDELGVERLTPYTINPETDTISYVVKEFSTHHLTLSIEHDGGLLETHADNENDTNPMKHKYRSFSHFESDLRDCYNTTTDNA